MCGIRREIIMASHLDIEEPDEEFDWNEESDLGNELL